MLLLLLPQKMKLNFFSKNFNKMRKIRLINITIPDLSSHYIKKKMYSVSLGNKVTKWFSNEKDAMAYLASVNRLLNQVLHELNYIYGNILAEYRYNWGHFDTIRKNEEKVILKSIDIIDRAFILVIERCGLTNGNHFTFNNLWNVMTEIDIIITICTNLFTELKHYAQVHKMDVFKKMIANQRKDLQNIGTKVEIMSEEDEFAGKIQENED